MVGKLAGKAAFVLADDEGGAEVSGEGDGEGEASSLGLSSVESVSGSVLLSVSPSDVSGSLFELLSAAGGVSTLVSLLDWEEVNCTAGANVPGCTCPLGV